MNTKNRAQSYSYLGGRRKGKREGYEQGYQNGVQLGLQHTLWPIALIIAQVKSFPSLEIILLQPFRLMKKLGIYNYRLVTEDFVTREDIASAQIVIFIRNVEPLAYKWLEAAHEMGKQTVYVIDDNFLHIPSAGTLTNYYQDPDRRETFIRFLTFSKVVQVISPYFADYIRLHFNPNVVCFPASVDFELLDAAGPKPVRNDGNIVFGYEGTAKDEDFKPVVPAIIKILQEYGPRIRVEFLGFIPPGLQGLPGVSFLSTDYEYRQFMQTLYRTSWDFGLAPLTDSLFNLCKTNNKFREYSGCLIPGIYTHAPAYSDCIVQEETGYLVPQTTEGWYLGMKRMIEDAVMRNKIKEQAGAYSRQHFSLEQSVVNWRNHILHV
ncbi:MULTISPECIES: glycosyltransferase [unclassified Paenibacillus]|uniref:glycosyltransferase n=1 Tax=unclassified Paenibacillus TaxID=185978 RepID=UPI00278B89A9|nr:MULTISPECIES: glycosyltransferase [unclassified Paenibacillus]MDQ0901566.1 glycosyltransferase involved in cell wall biosynthesis [Paenibacillus sp. V4I7]MDQ0919932.1 glycosyltransferase involved in cell wall biosynthesis [Paenibacillus sp. V4I5]